MVQEEDGVAGAGIHVGHHRSDRVVAVGVRARVRALPHVGEVVVRVARGDEGVCYGFREPFIDGAREAVLGVALAWADVELSVGESL